MSHHVSNAAVWDPYLPSWLRGSWGPHSSLAETQTAAGSGQAQINSAEIHRVLRKQTDPAGDADVRTHQQGGGRGVTEGVTHKVPGSIRADYLQTTMSPDQETPGQNTHTKVVFLHRDNN
ncbi:hypothetical protein CesoFtcFv8_003336 [Champsocephalus esox]|uniref:Uncharacterized protein n=1 Tax=Champsocephalus esox TaxID=159716 RepID=A0AAN8CTM9_9TELE|nr:hypothetical protein CesoFtcFv8_003336 [Champsocephalus esox]